MNKHMATTALALGLVALSWSSGWGQTDDRSRVFNAPADRVWVVTRSTLKSLGWDVDKEDRDVGWIRTGSRRLEGEDYGVYAKGAKHRLRIVVKAQGPAHTLVTVERRVWKEERILWIDKDQDVPTTDHSVEKHVLDAIGEAI